MEFVYHQHHKWIGGDLLVNKIYSFVIGDFSCGSYLDLAQCRLISICILQCVLKIGLVTVLFVNKVWWLLGRLDFVGGDLNSRLMIKILASLEDLQKQRNYIHLCCSRFRGNWILQADLWQRSCVRACNFPSKLGMIWWAWRTRCLTLQW